MAFSDPLLDTFSVENVLLIAYERGNHLFSPEITPANWTLFPKSILRFLLVLFLFALES